MTSEHNRPSLGDLLAPNSAYRAASEANEPSRHGNFRDAEEAIASLAEILGVDARAVLIEFRAKGSALGELARRLLGVSGDRFDPLWIAFDVIQDVRSEGLRGASVFKEAARRLNAPDPTGTSSRNYSTETLRTYEKIGRKLLRSQRLVRMYVPDADRPSRSKV